MNWLLTLYGIGTAIPAVFLEYHYKSHPGEWLQNAPWYIVFQLMISYGVYRMVTTPGATLLDAFVVWAFSTIAMRCVVSLAIFHETIAPGTWAALVFVVLARVVQYAWR